MQDAAPGLARTQPRHQTPARALWLVDRAQQYPAHRLCTWESTFSHDSRRVAASSCRLAAQVYVLSTGVLTNTREHKHDYELC